MMLLGQPGAMLKMPGVSAQSVQTAVRDQLVTTLAGKTIALRGPLGRRSWQITMPTADMQLLDALTQLLDFTPGPWCTHLPGAITSNLLPVRATAFQSGFYTAASDATVGPFQADEGTVFPCSLLNPSGEAVVCAYQAPGVLGVPVNAGQVLSAGIYVTGDALTRLRLRFTNSSGTVIAFTEVVGAGVGGLTRTTFTGITVPPGAVLADLWVSGATRVAGPQIVIGDAVPAYVAGRGAELVTVSSLGQDLLHAEPGFVVESVKFVLQEIDKCVQP